MFRTFVSINYHSGTVTFQAPEMKPRIFRGSKLYSLSKIITSLLAKKELVKGAKAYLVHLTLRKWTCKEVAKIPLVREFSKNF